jgi:hypothetical protein
MCQLQNAHSKINNLIEGIGSRIDQMEEWAERLRREKEERNENEECLQEF